MMTMEKLKEERRKVEERIRALEAELYAKKLRRTSPQSVEKHDPRDMAIAGGDPSL